MTHSTEGYPTPLQEYAPLTFFVHVPKTAGSTVNDYLHQRRPNGRSHCEAFIHDDRLAGIAATADWLSGHVDLSTAEVQLAAATMRKVRFFSAVRLPTKQVMSHYNWIIEIAYRGEEFYYSHPPNIRFISESIRSNRFDASSIAKNLNRWSGLFLNTQSRIVLGHNFIWGGGISIQDRLDRYELVCRSEDISPLVRALTGAGTNDNRVINSSNYHFDPLVFCSDELVECLKVWNNQDEVLYEVVRERT